MREIKQIPILRVEETITCDICGNVVDHAAKCSVCKRDVCSECFHPKTKVREDIYVIPCPICRSHPKSNYWVELLVKFDTEEKKAHQKYEGVIEAWGKVSQIEQPKQRKE